MAYFSNGSEGEILDIQCAECIHADETAMCPIALVQLEYNYDQCAKGQEKLRAAMEIPVDKNGKCNMKDAIDCMGKVNPNRACFKRKLVFGDEEQISALNKGVSS